MAASVPTPRTAAARLSRGSSRSLVAALGVPVIAGVVTSVMAVVGFGASLSAPTAALGVAAGALVGALQAVYDFARSLATAEHDAVLEYFGGGLGPEAELREERRRLLRAIKELDFDRELGKLSEKDHAAISTKYRLRAIELGRELDGGGKLHPKLEATLRGDVDVALSRGEERDDDSAMAEAAMTSGVPNDDPDRPATAVAEAAASVRACSACATDNDADARFCKSCGQNLEA